MTTREERLFARVVGELPDESDVEWWAYRTKVELMRRRQSESAKRRWARKKEEEAY